LERLREQQVSGSEQAELEERRASLKKRLREVEAELDRLVTLYASGQMNAERLSSYVRGRESKIENLKLLLGGVENDLAAAHESQAEAESAASWLVTLASRVEEIEADTEEALEKRRELIRLLVDQITAGRDENGHARVQITYRFGPPEPADEADVTVYGDNDASASLTTGRSARR
jgi:DNA repair exonuclease SbcCD ATPase subunit